VDADKLGDEESRIVEPCWRRYSLNSIHELVNNSGKMAEIDAIDRKILAVLQADGRISNLRLADAVSLSPTAVLARTQRLLRDGYIQGFTARLDAARLGCAMTVFVEVLLDRTTPNIFDAFNAAVMTDPEIAECHMVAGGFDYLIKLRMRDMDAYREFASRRLWQFPGVRETRTYAVIDAVKEGGPLPL